MENTRPELKKEVLDKIGVSLQEKLTWYKADRQPLEEKWLQNMRQKKGEYDSGIKSKIDPSRSQVYPKDTHVKITGFTAKMMEMMFPATEKNYSIGSSAVPELPSEIVDSLVKGLEEAAGEDGEVNSEMIESAIKAFADQRARAMTEMVEDQHGEYEYVDMCKKVIKSAATYNIGYAVGPLVKKRKHRTWAPNEEGKYASKETTIRVPYYRFARVWDLFPDLAAVNWDSQDGLFERVIYSRHKLTELASDPRYITSAVNKYLAEHSEGNYTPSAVDQDLDADSDRSNVNNKSGRKYETYRFLGYLPGKTMRDLGVTVAEKDLTGDVFMDIQFIDNVVIKANLAPFGSGINDNYHAFIFSEDDDGSLLGYGLADWLRDSQLSLCSSARMLMDNAAASCGPITELNMDLIRGGDPGAIHAFKTIKREGMGVEAQYPAVRDIQINSHIDELLSLIQHHERRTDIESSLPAWMFGDNRNMGEAFRTSNNMSSMTGGASMVVKDIVRSFDKFIASVIGSNVEWNMEFGPEYIKGDFQTVARGAHSLVAKEIRGAAMDQFTQTATDEERALLKTRDILIDKLSARDLPIERVYDEATSEKILAGMRESQSKSAEVEEGLTTAKTEKLQAETNGIHADIENEGVTTEATLQEIMSRVEVNLANADAAEDRTLLDTIRFSVESAMKDAAQTSKGVADGGGQ